MSPRAYVVFWGIVLIGAVGLFVVLRPVLTPFVFGLVVAWLCNPLVGRCEDLFGSRGLATACITILSFIVTGVGVAALVPILLEEIAALIAALPELPSLLDAAIRDLQALLDTYIGAPELAQVIAPTLEHIGAITRNHMSLILQSLVQLPSHLLSGLSGALAFFSLVLMAPVVAFYCMRDFDTITDTLHRLIPPASRHEVRTLCLAIEQTISGFLRGQMTVCAILASTYVVALWSMGLRYALLIGLFSGLAVIIPYLGWAISFFLAALGAWLQTGSPTVVLMVAGLYCGMQVIENMLLTPRIIGNRVQLHPVWVLFALLACGHFLGVLGVLLAIPIAAVIGVLIRSAVARYKASPIFQDPSG